MAKSIGEVDVVVDLVAGPYLETDISVCRTGGRIVVVGLLGGAEALVDLGLLMRRRLTLRGTVLRPRADAEKAAATRRFANEVSPLFERGFLRPIVEKVMPLERASEAYDLVASNETFGKVVLAPGR
jgi:NADPH2:quinone reductase